jgi:hypothetical protein
MKRFNRQVQIERAIREDNDALELMLLRARNEELAVAITLTNEKVYVGKITQLFNPVTPTNHIGLIPLSSGFRDATTKEMELTIDYSATISQIAKKLDLAKKRIFKLEEKRSHALKDDLEADAARIDHRLEVETKWRIKLEKSINMFLLIVPTSQIMSAYFFDSEIYTTYFKVNSSDAVDNPEAIASSEQFI